MLRETPDPEILCRICELETPDGRRLFARRWGGDYCELVFVIVHGLGEHGGCYEEFANFAHQHHCATLVYDQHGHGLSPGKRGSAASLQTLNDDVAVAMQAASENWPRTRRVLLGHSMGGNLAMKFALERRYERPAKTIVTNPMLKPPFNPTRDQVFAAWLTGKILPSISIESDVDPRKLTADPEQIHIMGHDPLMHDRMSLDIGTELVTQGQWIVDHADELESPMMVLLGDDDELTAPEATGDFAESAGSLCETRNFPGMRHNLLHEKNRQMVFTTILEWALK